MRILITAGPTREPLDAVRYLGNRSSGRLGAALAAAALRAGHQVTAILGPIAIDFGQSSPAIRRIDVQTARQMHQQVLAQFPAHDLLIMAAAVADFRPIQVTPGKLPRSETPRLTIECEPTEDIAAAAAAIRRPDQRIIGFSLETDPSPQRAADKLRRKNLDLIVHNPLETMESGDIQPTLIYPNGRSEPLGCRPKDHFADILLERAAELFHQG